MSPSDRNASLAFLLSLGSLPAGCLLIDDGNTSDTNATTQGTDGSDGGTGNASTVTAGSNMTSAGATDGSATAADGTAGYADSGYADGGSGGMPAQCNGLQIPAECTTFAAKVVECQPTYADQEAAIAQYCACAISYYAPMGGADCPGAYSDLYACLGALSCADFMTDGSCMSELDAQVMACGGDGGGAATGSGGATGSTGA